jgi:hypothetical protein
MCGDFADGKSSDPLEGEAMDLLITLATIALIIFLFPYLLAAIIIVGGVFVAGITAFVLVVKSLFKRH